MSIYFDLILGFEIKPIYPHPYLHEATVVIRNTFYRTIAACSFHMIYIELTRVLDTGNK
jgi:hypothetical protein